MINHPHRSRKTRHPADAARNAAMGTIGKIADRAVEVYAKHGVRIERMMIVMDLTACHFQGGQKLRLDDLLAADDFNFMHDVRGINYNLDRDTYQLRNGFSPRFADFRAEAV